MGGMTSADQIPGLRERKKIRTRETIRREALRLFAQHGYANTTVEQIAEAADISASTFFRYFSNKASLLIPDQRLTPIIDAFLAAPAHLSPIAAYRSAVQLMFGAMTEADWKRESERQSLLYSLTEGQAALYAQWMETIKILTHALSLRLGLPVGDPRLRITAGAMAGAMASVMHGNVMPPTDIDHALAFLDAGLPLAEEG